MPFDDSSMGGTSGLTGEMGAPAPAAAAPAPQPEPSSSSAMIQPQEQPDMPAVAPPAQPHGVMKILDFVGDLLTGGGNNPSQISRDPETGARVVTPGGKMSTGRKFAKVGLEALQGAATAAGAPPGPGHTGRGVAAAVGQQMALANDREQQAEQMADKDFDEQQKTKLQNLNYQLLSRELISKQLADTRAGKAAGREQVDFSNRLQDRERGLGSYDLGFVKGAASIADLGNKNPGMIAKYHAGLIVPVPVYGENGETLGLQVFERKQNTNALPLPDGQQIHRFTPPKNVGDKPAYELYTPTNMSVAEATNADMKAYNDYQAYETAQQKKAESDSKIAEQKSVTNKNNAEAGKASAETKNANGLGEGDAASMTHDEILKGMLKGSIDITKVFGIRGKDTRRAQFIAEAQHADPSWTMEKYDRMRQVRKDYASGKEADQVESLNKFSGHAGDFAESVDGLRNSKTPFINKTINWLRQNATNDARVADILPKIDAVKNEFQNFITNHALQSSEIEAGKHMLNEDQTPAQMESAVKSFMKTVLIRAGTLNERYHRTIGEDVPSLLDNRSVQVIKNLGLSDYARAVVPSSTPNPQAAPAPGDDDLRVRPGEPTINMPNNGGIGVVRGGKWVKASQ